MRATTAAARRLRESNPVADDAFAGASGERLGQITFDHIIATPAQPATTTAAGSTTVPGRRRRAGLLAGGLGLTATAVAAVIVVASAGPVVPGGTAPIGHHGAAGQSAAQRFLLDAAATAAARPEGSGTYWYVRQTSSLGSRETEESWTTRNGHTSWMRAPRETHDRIIRWPTPQAGWSLVNGPMGPVIPFPPLLPLFSFPLHDLRKHIFKHVRGEHPSSGRLDWVSFGQLQGLPTSPAALKARLTALTRKPAMLTGPAAVFEALINLVTELPAPPQVRAAAFQALATLPIVIRVVTVNGHPGLRMSTSRFSWLRSATLVVDPATSQVQAVVDAEGGSMSITAGWVNRLP